MTIGERTRLRRTDRAMPGEAEIEDLLCRTPFGVTATSVDNQPFLHTSLFCYVPGKRPIYLHTALQGRTRDNILHNPQVCFSVAEIGRLLPADTAMEFSNEYASVIAFGHARALQPDSWPRLPNFIYAALQAVDTNIPPWQMPRLVFALLRVPFFGIDSQVISREMVLPFQTSEGAQVLAPNWDAINPVLEKMLGG